MDQTASDNLATPTGFFAQRSSENTAAEKRLFISRLRIMLEDEDFVI
jgi:hypothetical protein